MKHAADLPLFAWGPTSRRNAWLLCFARQAGAKEGLERLSELIVRGNLAEDAVNLRQFLFPSSGHDFLK
jgi:hypothetical protein